MSPCFRESSFLSHRPEHALNQPDNAQPENLLALKAARRIVRVDAVQLNPVIAVDNLLHKPFIAVQKDNRDAAAVNGLLLVYLDQVAVLDLRAHAVALHADRNGFLRFDITHDPERRIVNNLVICIRADAGRSALKHRNHPEAVIKDGGDVGCAIF